MYALNFNGRVTHSSVKNVQFMSSPDGEIDLFSLHTIHRGPKMDHFLKFITSVCDGIERRSIHQNVTLF